MTTHFESIKFCVFDAYGTLFDVHSAITKHRQQVGDQAEAVSTMWRRKQLEYTVVAHANESLCRFLARDCGFPGLFSLSAHGIANDNLRNTLLNAYLELDCYPEVPSVLRQIKALGIGTAVLSNGSPTMLQAAIHNRVFRNCWMQCSQWTN